MTTYSAFLIYRPPTWIDKGDAQGLSDGVRGGMNCCLQGLRLKSYEIVDTTCLKYPGSLFSEGSEAPQAYAKGHKLEKLRNTRNVKFRHVPISSFLQENKTLAACTKGRTHGEIQESTF